MGPLRDVAWAAGLFEGEGCFTLGGGRAQAKYPKVALAMTDRDVVQRFLGVVGLGRIDSVKPRPGHKPQWCWSCQGFTNVQAIVAAFWCFLGERRKARAEQLLRMFRCTAVWARYRVLCKRGHRLDGDNLFVDVNGIRVCVACRRLRARGYKARRDHVHV